MPAAAAVFFVVDRVLAGAGVAFPQRRPGAAVPAAMSCCSAGGEFAGLLPDSDEPQARAFAARLVRALDEPVDMKVLALQISAGVGLAQAAEGAAAEDVLEQADVALYRAKSTGPRSRSTPPAPSGRRPSTGWRSAARSAR